MSHGTQGAEILPCGCRRGQHHRRCQGAARDTADTVASARPAGERAGNAALRTWTGRHRADGPRRGAVPVCKEHHRPRREGRGGGGRTHEHRIRHGAHRCRRDTRLLDRGACMRERPCEIPERDLRCARRHVRRPVGQLRARILRCAARLRLGTEPRLQPGRVAHTRRMGRRRMP